MTPSRPDGAAAVQAWRSGSTDRAIMAAAVRHTLGRLVAIAPGRSVEVRVPPYAAVQCVAGPRHTRGTPANTIETDPTTWLQMATGAVTWAAAMDAGALRVSGQRADVSAYLPLPDAGPDAGPHTGTLGSPGPDFEPPTATK